MEYRWYYNDWFIALLFIFFFIFFIPLFVALVIIEKRKQYFEENDIKSFKSIQEIDQHHKQLASGFLEKCLLLKQEIAMLSDEISSEELVYTNDENLLIDLEEQRQKLITELEQIVEVNQNLRTGIISTNQSLAVEYLPLYQKLQEQISKNTNSEQLVYIMTEKCNITASTKLNLISKFYTRSFLLESELKINYITDVNVLVAELNSLYNQYNLQLSYYNVVIDKKLLELQLAKGKLLIDKREVV